MIHSEKNTFSPEYLQHIHLTREAVEILRRLRNSEPKLPALKLHPLDRDTYSLFSLLSLAPVAVAGTLWPYAQEDQKQTLTDTDVCLAFATHHALAVANDTDSPNPFTLGISITDNNRELFTWIHTLTAAQITENNMLVSYDENKITHANLINPDCLLEQSDFFAVHCGSVIAPISKTTADEIIRKQKAYTHLFGQLPTIINYQTVFSGVFATKIL